MGLSSSKSKTESTQNQQTNQTESGQTTPITPDWLTNAAQDYVGRIGSFGDMDPNQFVAGASPLQNAAWDNAGSLGDWRGQAATAAGLAQQAGQGGANLAGRAPAGTGGQMMRPANAFSGASGLVSGQGYQMPQSQPGYAQPRTGQPIGGGPAYGYNPASVGAAQIEQTPGATATGATAGSLLDNFSAYQNPYNDQVRTAALADYDNNAAQQRAQLEARGASAGAFGGSRWGIAEGQLGGEQARGRAALDAGLLDQGFNTAAQLSGQDAAARQQASIFNAGNQTGVSQFNAGQDASRAQAQAGFGQQAGLANQASYDSAGQFNAGANNQVSEFNAGQQDTALARQLASAQLLGQQAQDYGTGTRADLATMSGLGDQQRSIEQAYAMAGPAQLQLMGQLSGLTPYQILVGQNVNGTTAGTMTGTGTQTTTQSPSLFNMLMQGAGAASAFL